MSATLARRHAHRILISLEGRGPTLAERLAEPQVAQLDTRERALLHELVLGCLRQRGRLDHALRPLLNRPLTRLDVPTLQALRLGAHQVLNLRVPDRAAVSESVSLLQGGRSSSFVNAVLRRLCREGAPPLPDPRKDPAAWLCTGGSLPGWLADRWLARLGPETAVARARALLEEPATYFRFNPRRDSLARARERGVESEPTQVPDCWRLRSGRLTELASEGHVYVQDLGSQVVARLAAAEGGRTLDVCAAPGGKSLLLADLDAASPIVAADVSARRLSRVVAAAETWGAALRCLVADGLQPPFVEAFDTVLLDAPCSGLGTLARHPDIRWRLQLEQLRRHAQRQRDLLAAAAAAVRPGGRLVYATCSLEPEENDAVVDGFLAGHAGWEAAPVPDWAGEFAEGRRLYVRPEEHGCDGFFAAVLQRR